MNDSDYQFPIIQFDSVVKRFGTIPALAGLDLTVHPGQIHGFLGPNGSGKSTAIRVLLGLLHADDGEARLFGADPWRNAVQLHRRLAYVPGDVALWPALTGGQAIDVLASFRRPLDPARRAELIERFAFDPTRRCRDYSTGNRQKVALIAALAADVDLLVLDEPTSGLDPLMEVAFQDTVRQAAARGTTVLLSSHILAEVEQLCDWVTIIRAGRTVRTGALADMQELSNLRVSARTRRPAIDLIAALPGVLGATGNGNLVEFSVPSGRLDAAMTVLAEAEMITMTCRPPSLAEIFLDHYQDQVSVP